MAKFGSVLLLGVVLLGLSRPGLSLTALKQVVAANNDFAMDLYGQIRSNSAGENIFFSSFSVSSALAMVYAGAKGNTKTEMGYVLKFGHVRDRRINRGFRRLFKAFNDPTNKYTLNVANAFFGREGYPFLQRYLNVVSRSYFALLKNVDFRENLGSTCKFINEWVADNTNQKIKKVLSPQDINADTVAVLVNSIYFKGMWKIQFDVQNTISRTFHLTTTKSMTTNMMNLSGKKFNHAEVSSLNCTIVELPYVGDEVSMYILLPDSINGLAALESQLTSAELDNAISLMKLKKVDVAIPKFSMTLTVELKDMLKELGMTDVFGKADLSGMDGTRTMFVSTVVHKAYIDVNEEGTEAAAATAVGTGRSFFQRRTLFKADHPFLFFIREKVTGIILFSGRVVTPPQADSNSSSTPTGSQQTPPCCLVLPDRVCDLFQRYFGDNWCHGSKYEKAMQYKRGKYVRARNQTV